MSRRVLLVGIGGLGCPAAIALARGVDVLGVADDDEVDLSNLHRQILFSEADVGQSKVVAATRVLSTQYGVKVEAHATRLLPHNAVSLISQYDLVVEGSDNFATKFLAADAARLAGKPIVHAAAVRWHGTALAVGPAGGPCYRCIFEDVPLENAPNCAEAGVIGPVVGVVAAVQANLALSALDGEDVFGELFTFDGKTLEHRRRRVAGRKDCVLCGPAWASASPENPAVIRDIQAKRYVEGVACAQA